MRDDGGGGSKIVQNRVTSFMDDPLVSLPNTIFLNVKVRGMRLMGGHNATAFLLDSSIDLKRSAKIFSFQKVFRISIILNKLLLSLFNISCSYFKPF